MNRSQTDEKLSRLTAHLQFRRVLVERIVLDLNLPMLSGFEVLERNPRKDIPVVVFRASANKFDVQRTLLLGAVPQRRL